jgi:metal-responsive CopG/Arc/MetJ family transcriptional regulator
MKTSTTTTIRLPASLIDWIDATAARERRSRNNLVRLILEDYQRSAAAQEDNDDDK